MSPLSLNAYQLYVRITNCRLSSTNGVPYSIVLSNTIKTWYDCSLAPCNPFNTYLTRAELVPPLIGEKPWNCFESKTNYFFSSFYSIHSTISWVDAWATALLEKSFRILREVVRRAPCFVACTGMFNSEFFVLCIITDRRYQVEKAAI